MEERGEGNEWKGKFIETTEERGMANEWKGKFRERRRSAGVNRGTFRERVTDLER